MHNHSFSIALTIPLPAVIISLTVKEHRYNIYRFPPSICDAGTESIFYSVILIKDVVLCTGICLLILVFWFLCKVFIYFYDTVLTFNYTEYK